jgi:hypothetical protein
MAGLDRGWCGAALARRWQGVYFLASDATMRAVPVTAAGASFEAGTPVALFPTRIVDGGTVAQNRPQYAVARDGTVPDQPAGGGRHCRADHADPELESGGEEGGAGEPLTPRAPIWRPVQAEEQFEALIDRGQFGRRHLAVGFRMRRLSIDRTWSVSTYDVFVRPLAPGARLG